MRPLTLKLTNFGPFLDETIDFQQVNNDQLFLISGKTGSGKTMIFDAIVFALFGEASTKDRNEGDLRSHFADGKSPMVVEFEFKLRDSIYKINRQGAFVKEGNKNKTLGQLSIYQLEDTFELRESKVNAGNQFIRTLLGVNSEQFRQLFILPQGEFKRFLLSKSIEKQEILRTLFNSQRFEEIQKLLNDDVKEVRANIEKRYHTLETDWMDLETFDETLLNEYKEVSSRQTDKIKALIPQFKSIGQSIQNDLLAAEKRRIEKFEQAENLLNRNLKLQDAITSLEENKQKQEALLSNQSYIKNQIKLLNEINEVRPLSNLLDSKEKLLKKHKEIEKDKTKTITSVSNLQEQLEDCEKQLAKHKDLSETIDKSKTFIENCKIFYKKIDKYKKLYQQIENLKNTYAEFKSQYEKQKQQLNQYIEKLNDREPDYKRNEQLNEKIHQLDNEIKIKKQNELNKKEYQTLQKRQSDITTKNEHIKSEINTLDDKYKTIDKTNIDLNNKQDMIIKLQSVLSKGDKCPLCGNEIHEIEHHIDFDELTKRHDQLNNIEQQRLKLKEQKIKYDSELQHILEQLHKFNLDELEKINYTELELTKDNLLKEKRLIEEENEEIRNLKEKILSLRQKSHELELDLKTKQFKLDESTQMINDFENTTQYKDVNKFMTAYDKSLEKVNEYQKKYEWLVQQIQKYNNELSLEMNNKAHLEDTIKSLQKDIKEANHKIDHEMNRIGFTSLKDVEHTINEIPNKAKIEAEINKFNQEKQQFEIIINQLQAEINNQELRDISQLKKDFEQEKIQLDQAKSLLSQHNYKLEFNNKKIDNIYAVINHLEKELQEQQEVFQLAEVLSGKNEQKLTLENFVLIYYLERILAHANQRLSLMTGERYQLVRREQTSKGYSGLEIDVFDSHSNKKRHITSLSGGETFQASLALALGLSEVVQQESGGIALDSMFIDEGFGTLDQETLETALDTLLSLKSSGRMVGIISHVSELKQRIPLILEVQTEQYQSTTNFIKQ
ncbi:exonuclease subunit SbcC [Staphylococcus cohnii]|uniref:exonuclease subunit SbcC n=1 Tax=Staphylococcus cohnii TaxID=29382 RepID=UPI0003186B14|nr:exonuclease subunit SbcC [Staphylococcus cohnii]